MADLFTQLQKAKEEQEQTLHTSPPPDKEKVAQKDTRKPTQNITRVRDLPRNTSRENVRKLPTRDEIQGFSFQLRDELKVKVQAEVPYQWQDELDEIARQLKVKKLELYRFIIGEFLGKVKRNEGEGR